MTSEKPVNLASLEALGAKCLAELLLELADEDAGIKRRLRFELSAQNGAEAIAGDIGQRLATIRQARSFIDGRNAVPSSRTSTCSASSSWTGWPTAAPT
jgi:hypothetical protein